MKCRRRTNHIIYDLIFPFISQRFLIPTVYLLHSEMYYYLKMIIQVEKLEKQPEFCDKMKTDLFRNKRLDIGERFHDL